MIKIKVNGIVVGVINKLEVSRGPKIRPVFDLTKHLANPIDYLPGKLVYSVPDKTK